MEELARALIGCGAIRFGKFTLASGASSDYYVDIKRASTDPQVLRLMGAGLAAQLADADRIAGMELGAVPLAAAAALAADKPFIMVRKQAKGYGTDSQLEGPHAAGEKVVVVEDVTTSGGSSLDAVRILRAAGLQVIGVVTVVDRESGAAEAFAAADVPFKALVAASDLLAMNRAD